MYEKLLSPVRSSSRHVRTSVLTGSPLRAAKDMAHRIAPPFVNMKNASNILCSGARGSRGNQIAVCCRQLQGASGTAGRRDQWLPTSQ